MKSGDCVATVEFGRLVGVKTQVPSITCGVIDSVVIVSRDQHSRILGCEEKPATGTSRTIVDHVCFNKIMFKSGKHEDVVVTDRLETRRFGDTVTVRLHVIPYVARLQGICLRKSQSSENS